MPVPLVQYMRVGSWVPTCMVAQLVRGQLAMAAKVWFHPSMLGLQGHMGANFSSGISLRTENHLEIPDVTHEDAFHHSKMPVVK